jgi:hypothetical protein
MKEVANRPGPQGRAARTRLYQITKDQGFLGHSPLSTKDTRFAFRELRKLQRQSYKAMRALNPKASKAYLWSQVEKALEEDETSWNPYPEGEEEALD